VSPGTQHVVLSLAQPSTRLVALPAGLIALIAGLVALVADSIEVVLQAQDLRSRSQRVALIEQLTHPSCPDQLTP
jgi:hypothetical protein